MSNLYFEDPTYEFECRGLVGNIHYGCGDFGEVTAAIAAIADGQDDTWVAAWRGLGDRVAGIADDVLAHGHRVSARNAYLRAAVYYSTGMIAADGVANPTEVAQSLFTAHRRCFDAHVDLLDVPAERVAIPYEGDTLPGYLFRPSTDGHARPTLIAVNGSDGAVTYLWPTAAAAVARGYNALVFDGPGQQSMLFERHVPFRSDWEHVITPVVDDLVARSDVDADRIAVYGVSQGGYWVPRALAFETRVAAAILDPGVDDVFASWRAQTPDFVLSALDDNDEKKFNELMDMGSQSETPRQVQTAAWRSKPYGQSSPYSTYKAVEQYRLGDLVQQIHTPILITDPEGEQFWPGQSQRLFDALPGPHKIRVPFTKAEGADMHCEPLARALVEQRMFDWLDDTLGILSGPARPPQRSANTAKGRT